jgi:hypothetical protein
MNPTETHQNRKKARDQKKALLIVKAQALQNCIRLEIQHKKRPANQFTELLQLMSEQAHWLQWQTLVAPLMHKILNRYTNKYGLGFLLKLAKLFKRRR